MDIKIQSIHFDINSDLESIINSKLTKMMSHNEDILKAEVILKVDKAQSENNKIVEINLKVSGKNLFAKKQSDSFEESLSSVINALKRQIKRFKDKN